MDKVRAGNPRSDVRVLIRPSFVQAKTDSLTSMSQPKMEEGKSVSTRLAPDFAVVAIRYFQAILDKTS